ncbi:hypothetical protein JHK87_053190 [Glycine soja]|nr:hypothetical protein JHK87_053190 [Glycine soja]
MANKTEEGQSVMFENHVYEPDKQQVTDKTGSTEYFQRLICKVAFCQSRGVSHGNLKGICVQFLIDYPILTISFTHHAIPHIIWPQRNANLISLVLQFFSPSVTRLIKTTLDPCPATIDEMLEDEWFKNEHQPARSFQQNISSDKDLKNVIGEGQHAGPSTYVTRNAFKKSLRLRLVCYDHFWISRKGPEDTTDEHCTIFYDKEKIVKTIMDEFSPGKVLYLHGSTLHPYPLAYWLCPVEVSIHKRNQLLDAFFLEDQGKLGFVETPPKSYGNTDQGLMKKLKDFDGLAMSIGNGHAESAKRRVFEFLDISLSYVGDGGVAKICHLKLFSELNLLSLYLSRMVVHELLIVMESYR